MRRSSGRGRSGERTPPARRAERYAPYLVLGPLLLLWEGASRVGLVDDLILPPPSRVLRTGALGLFGAADISYHIGWHAAHSLTLLGAGFVLGVVAGVAGGVLLGSNVTLYRAAGPVLGVLLPIPAIAWAPVAMIWIGLGAPAVLAIVVYACFAEVVLNTTTGIRSVPRRYVWQVQTFGAGRWFVLARVVLPAAWPHVLAGIKLGLAASWRSLIGAEMFAGVAWGLGFMLFEAQNFYATDVMFAALAIVAMVSLLMEQVGLRAVERRTLERWGLARTVET